MELIIPRAKVVEKMKRQKIAIITHYERIPMNPFVSGMQPTEAVAGVVRYVQSRDDWDMVGFGVPLPPAQNLLSLGDIRPDRVAGAIIAGGPWRKIAALCLERGVPTAATNWLRDEPAVPTASPDDLAIGRLAAQHFLRRGFRTLVFCGPHYLATREEMITGSLAQWLQRRLQGFTETAAAAGAECSVFYDPEGARPGESDDACVKRFSRDLREWVRGLVRPVGILACNDVWATDCLGACREEGLRVPFDAAVMGVDNETFRCEVCRTTLSSIDRNMFRVGFETAAVLGRFLTTGEWGEFPVLVPPVGVVERLSTDVLAVENPRLAAALRFAHAHFCEPISVRDVARAVGVSERQLRREFERDLGFSLVGEIRRLRVEKARGLLTGTDLPLKTIADAVGFRRENYLCNVFARDLGVSPGAWRSAPYRAGPRRGA